MAARNVASDIINSKKSPSTDTESELVDEDTLSIDHDDIVHDDLIGDLIIRLLNSPLIDDPYWLKKDAIRTKEPPAYLKFDISYDEITQLCALACASFLEQSALIQIDEEELPLHIVADIHGNLPQILRIFRLCTIPQKETFLFLGDYVDRGVQGLEVITLLFCLKIRYPFQVYLLRGNHEDANTTLNYGFFDECITRYPQDNCELGVKTNTSSTHAVFRGRRCADTARVEEASFCSKAHCRGNRLYTDRCAFSVWKAYLEAFNCMPVAALVANTIFCAHGGISPFIDKLEDINKVQRPSVVPAYGIGCDLVWSDPAPQRSGWVLSHRGISFLFGSEAVEEFCRKHNVDLIVRGHQISNEMYKNGYRISFNGRLVTLFSAPNYMNYKNNSCLLTVTKKMDLKFTVFRCRYYQFGRKKRIKKVDEKKEKKSNDKKDEDADNAGVGSPQGLSDEPSHSGEDVQQPSPDTSKQQHSSSQASKQPKSTSPSPQIHHKAKYNSEKRCTHRFACDSSMKSERILQRSPQSQRIHESTLSARSTKSLPTRKKKQQNSCSRGERSSKKLLSRSVKETERARQTT